MVEFYPEKHARPVWL